VHKDLLDRAKNGEIVILPPQELTELLGRAEIVFEEDTFHSSMIRIVRLDEHVLVQETTDSGLIIVRARPTVEDAHAFVRRRMETYERMWDTCGLRVSYFDQ
jgi:hypothetical protein